MALETDTVNIVNNDLRGPMQFSFTRSNYLWAKLEAMGKVNTSEAAPLIIRPFMQGSPHKGEGMFTGDESLDLSRRSKTEKYTVEPHRLVIPLTISNKILRRTANSENAAANLLDAYVKADLDGAAQDINSYLLTGVSAGLVFTTAQLSGLSSLNGLFTGGNGTGVTNGLLDFAAPASQTDNVQNVAKTSTGYHYNQYGDITAFGTNGKRTLRKVWRACYQYGVGSGPDLVLMDDDTYANYEEEKGDLIRLQAHTDQMDGKGDPSKNVLLGGMVCADLAIDLSLFTGAAADGVTYMLNTKYLEHVVYEKFNVSKFNDIDDQDGIVAKACYDGGLMIRRFPAMGCVSGGSA